MYVQYTSSSHALRNVVLRFVKGPLWTVSN